MKIHFLLLAVGIMLIVVGAVKTGDWPVLASFFSIFLGVFIILISEGLRNLEKEKKQEVPKDDVVFTDEEKEE